VSDRTSLLGWLLRLIEPLQDPFTALPMIIYKWAGDAKAEFKTALAPAAIIVLMAITFLCNGVGAVPPESLRQAVMNAQLLLRADSR
jgi:ABC-type phosphate transport system permease subunit